jgi:hypothetical protein
MIRKQTVSLILAVALALTVLVSPVMVSMNAGSTSAGAIPAEIANNPSGGGNTGG